MRIENENEDENENDLLVGVSPLCCRGPRWHFLVTNNKLRPGQWLFFGLEGGKVAAAMRLALQDLVARCRRLWAAYVILLIALLTTGIAFWRTRHQSLARQQMLFDRAVEQTSQMMELYFGHYLNVLAGVKGLFETDQSVTPGKFGQYLESIRLAADHPGLLDIGYVVRVPAAEREAHLAFTASLGLTNYIPQLEGDWPDFYPVVYLKDFTAVGVLPSGWNAFSEPVRRAAMEKARDTGKPAASGKTELFTVDHKQGLTGFLLYEPVYRAGARPATTNERRAELVGFAFGSILSQELWAAMLKKSEPPLVDLEVYAAAEPFALKREELLFESDGQLRGVRQGGAKLASRFSQTNFIAGLERVWGLHLASLPALEEGPGAQLPLYVLLGGLAISGGLFLLAWTQVRARARAEQLAGELRLSDTALAAEKERLAVTLRSIGDGVITTDTAGKVVLVNQMAEQLTGWSQAEACGRSLVEVFQTIDQKTRAGLPNTIASVLQTGQLAETTTPVVLVSRNGAERVIATSAAPIQDAGKLVGVVLAFRDVTEWQKLEEERLRASKLESIGILAGGIAHDFNNILMAIVGNVSLAEQFAREQPELRPLLLEAQKAGWRARDLTHQLLIFARGGAPIKETAVLTDIIKDSARFVTPGSNVHCEFSLAHDLWPVEADKGQLSQVIANLVLNAVQAMPEGGTVQVRAENLALSAPASLPLPAGRYVRVSVQDHGIGIKPEHLPKVFDPYFTTKQRGSGLGLATAYSIVRRHDGLIRVSSQLGQGSLFEVYLPASAKAPPPPPEPCPPPQPGQGTVLVMDDEPAVLEVCKASLKQLGYEVLLARDGAEAVRLYREAQQAAVPITALILDLTVPGGMGGKETVKRLLELDPQVRAIVSSGYSNDPVMADFRAHGFCGVISKPYAVEQLAEALRRALASGAPSR